MDLSNHRLNRNNVNDNDSKRLKNNVIVNVDKVQTDVIAEKLVDKLQNPGGRMFYCKVAWHIPENKVWYYLDIALTGRDPRKYFSWLCKQDMV